MSPLHAPQFGLDPYRIGPAQSPIEALRRRVSGRFSLDPFGLDPQLCDMLLPIVRTAVKVEVEGGERIPREGPAVLVANRGVGLGEPIALSVAVAELTGRRVRFIADRELPALSSLTHRFGAVTNHPGDIAAMLRAGHIVAVPLSPTWLRTRAGRPPLELCAAMMGFTVFPIAVAPGGPLGMPVRPWRVKVGAHVALDGSYAHGDPLGAAELGEAARDAVHAMLAGGDPSVSSTASDLAS